MTRMDGKVTWREMEIGNIVTDPGNGVEYQTGDWRTQKPVYQHERCIKCGYCSIFCPEGCIKVTEDGFFEADMFYCKGCGICARECWSKAISMVEES